MYFCQRQWMNGEMIIMKKVAWIFLLLPILLCSCGESEEIQWNVREQTEKNWEISDTVAIPEYVNVRSVICKQNAIFYRDDEQDRNLLVGIPYESPSDEVMAVLEYPGKENQAENYFMMACDNGMDNTDYLTLWKVKTSFEDQGHYELVCYGQNGEISENKIIDTRELQEEIENIQKIVEKDSTYYFLMPQKLVIVDARQKTNILKLQSKMYDLFHAGDRILLAEYTDEKIVLYDITAGMIGDSFLEIPMVGNIVYMENGNILISAAKGVYCCDVESQCIELLFEWGMVGLVNSDVAHVLYASEDKFLIGGYQGNTYTIWTLTTTDMVDERKVITLMTRNDSSMWLSSRVYEFNELNEEYRVVLDNPTSGLEEEDVMTKQQLLLTSSTPPDVVDLCYVERWEEYAQNGLFEDLTSYFEQSDVLEKTDYLPNILEGGKVGEKQIFIPYSFGFTMLYGKEEYLGEEPGWTLQELLERCGQQEEISVLNGEPTMVLESLLLLSMEEFVDYSEAACNFETPLFYELLQCAAKARYTEGDYTVFGSSVLEERALMDVAVLYNMESYLAYTGVTEENTTDKEIKLVLKGYPSVSGEMRGEAYLPSGTYFGICSNSKNKEGAWEFVEYCLSYKQDFVDAFPARKDWLLESLKNIETRHFTSGKEFREITKEDEEQLLSIVEGLRFTSNQDEIILQVVKEEAQEYFQGQKSEEETAGIIQNRIQMYLWENGE